MQRVVLVLSIAFVSTGAMAQDEAPRKAIGVHAGVGTDVELGLGVGGGVTVWVPTQQLPFDLEIGGQFFYHRSEYTDDEGIHSYTETTTLSVLAVRANLLFDYTGYEVGLYYVVGGGAAAVNVVWEERSPTDTSLGAPLPNGGSKQEDDGTAGAVIANAGIGYTFGGGFDMRAELPLLVFLGEVGEAASIAPTVTLTAGYRF